MHSTKLIPWVALCVTVIVTDVAGQTLSTMFASDNRRSRTPPVNQMDLIVRNPAGLTFVAVDVNCPTEPGTVVEIEIYTTPVTYVGNELNPSMWTKVSEGRGVAQGVDNPTPIDIRDFRLPLGSHGVGIHYRSGGSAYTNGMARFDNSELGIRTGTVTGNLFATPLFAQRIWNGTWHYFAGTATYGTYGEGCAHAGGVPTIVPRNPPRFNETLTLDVRNLDPTGQPAAMLVGVENAMWSGEPLPLDLARFGAPGCSILITIALSDPLPNNAGTGSWSLDIPPRTDLIGLPIFQQALAVAPDANALGIVVSAAGEGLLGN